MRDDRVGTFGGSAAGLADRTQIPGADVAGQALMGQAEPEVFEFIKQGAGPQMRVLQQTRGDVVDEPVERIRARPGTFPGLALTGQVSADRLAVEPGMAGDRRDRPTTFA
jgi:hypothetical protein